MHKLLKFLFVASVASVASMVSASAQQWQQQQQPDGYAIGPNGQWTSCGQGSCYSFGPDGFGDVTNGSLPPIVPAEPEPAPFSSSVPFTSDGSGQ